jgi:hypothetical protein
MAIAVDERLTKPSEVRSSDSVITATRQFKQLGADDQIALIGCVYIEIGQSITNIVQGARLQQAKLLVDQISQMTHVKQLQIVRDLANQVNTSISRSYGALSVNTKLCFWYILSNSMLQHDKLPSANPKISTTARDILGTIKKLNYGQQITLLRNAVIDMGVEPPLS